jgi:hypothetical protein
MKKPVVNLWDIKQNWRNQLRQCKYRKNTKPIEAMASMKPIEF